VTFLLAGHETVATALTFALLLAAQHRTVTEHIADEAETCVRSEPAERFERLPYTRAVLAESMRLYPPVWILARQTKSASMIGTHAVPAGAMIFVSQWVIHRDARFFADPLRFVPARFLRPASPRHAYFPFGAGPRQCIGESFAWLEGTLVLAEIVRRWRLQLVSDASPALTAKVTLRPADPVVVRVTTRSAALR
jgi:cytochrome P450